MAKHYFLEDWSAAACGLECGNFTADLTLVDCKVCARLVSAAGDIERIKKAWLKCGKGLKRFYFQRAGFAPAVALPLIKKDLKKWPARVRVELFIQMSSNPELARLMVVPVVPILRGSINDKKRQVAGLWSELGRSAVLCAKCGGLVC